jgi:hypothetical protein
MKTHAVSSVLSSNEPDRAYTLCGHLVYGRAIDNENPTCGTCKRTQQNFERFMRRWECELMAERKTT